MMLKKNLQEGRFKMQRWRHQEGKREKMRILETYYKNPTSASRNSRKQNKEPEGKNFYL